MKTAVAEVERFQRVARRGDVDKRIGAAMQTPAFHRKER